MDQLRYRFPSWAFPHLSFTIHRRGSDAADSSQRSRAFLYASLGTAVATELGVDDVYLGDNGVVSLNLPINDQLVGALVSRGTHPKFLELFNDFIESIFPDPPCVSNPLRYRTRAEVLGILQAHGCAPLLQETSSCSRERGRPAAQPQCGYCSQCVDRRFGAIASGLEDHDLVERYGLDIFTQPLPEGEAQTVALSYVRFARQIQKLTSDDLFLEYPQLYECLSPSDPRPDETAEHILGLLKRHATGMLDTLAVMIKRQSQPLARGDAARDSLIQLVTGSGHEPPLRPIEQPNILRREGQIWTIAFRGYSTRLKQSKGILYLARLLAHPGDTFHVIDLGQHVGTLSPPTEARPPRDQEKAQLDLDGFHHGTGNAGPMIDARAKAEVNHNLVELDEALQTALARGDTDEAAELDEMITTLSGYLSSGTAIGGRARQFRSEDIRVHDAVTKAIRRMLESIAAYHPELGRHLDRSLNIGWDCAYRPDPHVAWDITVDPT